MDVRGLSCFLVDDRGLRRFIALLGTNVRGIWRFIAFFTVIYDFCRGFLILFMNFSRLSATE